MSALFVVRCASVLCLVCLSVPSLGCSVKDAERTQQAWRDVMLKTDMPIKLKIIQQIADDLLSDSPGAYDVLTGSVASDPAVRSWGPRYGFLWIMQQLNALIDLMGKPKALDRQVTHFVVSNHLHGGEDGTGEDVAHALASIFSGFLSISDTSRLVWRTCISKVLNRLRHTTETVGAQVIRAQCDVHPASGDPTQPIQGSVNFEQSVSGGSTVIAASLSGFHTDDRETLHGFHIHEHGALGNGCKDAGGHYNPEGRKHGAPSDVNRHVGDMGNLWEDTEGKVYFNMWDRQVALIGESSVLGRAVVIHARADFPGNKTYGHAGARVACCVIHQL